MNTTNRRWWRLVAIFLALGVFAAACGSDGGDTAGESDDSTEAVEAPEAEAESEDDSDEAMEDESDSDEEEAMEDDGDVLAIISEECPIHAPAESTTIDLMGWEFPVTAAIGEEFGDCSSDNLSVNVQLLDNTAAQDQINLDLAAGSPEFEIIHATDSLIGTWADDLVDLSPFIEQYSEEFALDDIPQAMWDGATVDGQVLGVPLFSNTMHFFYNTEIFDANGIEVPETCLLYTSPSPRDATLSRMPSSA